MGQRLYATNLSTYVQETYGQVKEIKKQSISGVVPFLQRTFEGRSDCTLTSILTICKFYNLTINNLECYNFIKNVAKKYFYTNDFGTIPLFINKIIKPVFKQYNIYYTSKSKYLKNICWNINNVIQHINNGNPIILSIHTDNRDYYKNHSVVCKGYVNYITEDNKNHYFLEIFDNWNLTNSYIDYNKLGVMSSINYFLN